MAVPKSEAQPVAAPTRVGLIDRFSVVLIAVAAMLWASDTYFRAQLIGHLTPSQIVVVEDALVSLFLVTFLLRGIPEMRRLDRRGWLAIGLIGVGPQAVATILFTTSFSYRHFAETFVLQQTQPLIAILLAWIILGERRRPWFWPAAALAIVGVYMVVFAQNLMATIAEMAYPVAATFIASAPPPYGFNQPLYLPQFVGTGLLIAVIFILNWSKERTPPVIVQQDAAA